jgi:hypothetical protein
VAVAVGAILSILALLFAIPLVAALAGKESVKTADLVLFLILFLIPALPGFICLGIGLVFRRAEIDFDQKRIRVRSVRWFGVLRDLREFDFQDLKFVEIASRAAHGRTGQVLAVRVVLAVSLRDEPNRRRARVQLTGEISVLPDFPPLIRMLDAALRLAREAKTRLMGPQLLTAPDLEAHLRHLKMKDLAPAVLEGPEDVE